MPIGRLSIHSGQEMGQFWEQGLGMVLTVAFGLLVGWSPHVTAGHALELVTLMAVGMVAFIWAGVLFGMLRRSPDAVQGMGFIVILPLTFMAGTFVPIAGMGAVH